MTFGTSFIGYEKKGALKERLVAAATDSLDEPRIDVAVKKQQELIMKANRVIATTPVEAKSVTLRLWEDDPTDAKVIKALTRLYKEVGIEFGGGPMPERAKELLAAKLSPPRTPRPK